MGNRKRRTKLKLYKGSGAGGVRQQSPQPRSPSLEVRPVNNKGTPAASAGPGGNRSPSRSERSNTAVPSAGSAPTVLPRRRPVPPLSNPEGSRRRALHGSGVHQATGSSSTGSPFSALAEVATPSVVPPAGSAVNPREPFVSLLSSPAESRFLSQCPSFVGDAQFPWRMTQWAATAADADGRTDAQSSPTWDEVSPWMLRAPASDTEKATYHNRWSQVVMGATSGLVFLAVLVLCYASYTLVRPYLGSIVSAVLLSLVLHPRSKAGSSVSMETCLARVQRTKAAWSVGGKALGVAGALLSLYPFASYVAMQTLFFLGLHKLRIRNKWLVAYLHTRVETATTLRKRSAKMAKVPPNRAAGATSETKAPNAATDAQPPVFAPITTPRGRRFLRVLTVSALLLLAHVLVGWQYFVLCHCCLAVVFSLAVAALPTRTFVTHMSRVWHVILLLFFLLGLTYNLALDVASLAETVKRTTTAVVVKSSRVTSGVSGTSTTESESVPMAVYLKHDGARPQQAQEPPSTLPDLRTAHESSSDSGVLLVDTEGTQARGGDAGQYESIGDVVNGLLTQHHAALTTFIANTLQRSLGETLNGTNVTVMATQLLDTITPWLHPGRANGKAREGLRERLSAALASLSRTSVWVDVGKQAVVRLLPYVEYSARVVAALSSNVLSLFDYLYAASLFLLVFKYLMGLDRTVLFYIFATLFKPMQPELGEYHARSMECDIIASLASLLHSFWHLSSYHFTITFVAFKLCALPLPFLAGVLSVALALFPLMPKRGSPCTAAFLTSLMGSLSHGGVVAALVNGNLYILLAAMTIEVDDDWLLQVSGRLRTGGGGARCLGDLGQEREQFHPVVVGTAIVLGFVAYGAHGIVLGPLIVIVARVFFDNWDVVVAKKPATAKSPAPAKKGRRGVDDRSGRRGPRSDSASSVTESEDAG